MTFSAEGRGTGKYYSDGWLSQSARTGFGRDIGGKDLHTSGEIHQWGLSSCGLRRSFAASSGRDYEQLEAVGGLVYTKRYVFFPHLWASRGDVGSTRRMSVCENTTTRDVNHDRLQCLKGSDTKIMVIWVTILLIEITLEICCSYAIGALLPIEITMTLWYIPSRPSISYFTTCPN